MTSRERYGWALLGTSAVVFGISLAIGTRVAIGGIGGFSLFAAGLLVLISEDAARNIELPRPPVGGPSAADKALWGFIRMMAPLPIQEIVRRATEAEQLASICGWIHVSGRWYWHRESNTLAKVSARFVDAFERAAHDGLWDE